MDRVSLRQVGPLDLLEHRGRLAVQRGGRRRQRAVLRRERDVRGESPIRNFSVQIWIPHRGAPNISLLLDGCLRCFSQERNVGIWGTGDDGFSNAIYYDVIGNSAPLSVNSRPALASGACFAQRTRNLRLPVHALMSSPHRQPVNACSASEHACSRCACGWRTPPQHSSPATRPTAQTALRLKQSLCLS